MAEGYGIWHALVEMGRSRNNTSLAYVFLLCPNRRIVAKIQIGSGCDESTVHLMRP